MRIAGHAAIWQFAGCQDLGSFTSGVGGWLRQVCRSACWRSLRIVHVHIVPARLETFMPELWPRFNRALHVFHAHCRILWMTIFTLSKASKLIKTKTCAWFVIYIYISKYIYIYIGTELQNKSLLPLLLADILAQALATSVAISRTSLVLQKTDISETKTVQASLAAFHFFHIAETLTLNFSARGILLASLAMHAHQVLSICLWVHCAGSRK